MVHVGHPVRRHEPVRRLHPDQPAPCGRDADAAGFVGAERDVDESRGDGRGGARRRSAGREPRVSWVARRAERGTLAESEAHVLEVGLGGDDHACVEQSLDDDGVLRRHRGRQPAPAVGHRYTGDGDAVLDTEAPSGERTVRRAAHLAEPDHCVVRVLRSGRRPAGIAVEVLERNTWLGQLLQRVEQLQRAGDRSEVAVDLVGSRSPAAGAMRTRRAARASADGGGRERGSRGCRSRRRRVGHDRLGGQVEGAVHVAAVRVAASSASTMVVESDTQPRTISTRWTVASWLVRSRVPPTGSATQSSRRMHS